MSDFALMRQNMVKGQILPEEVTHLLVLEAFSKVPKEAFVPRQLSHIAYIDENFPLNANRVLLRPAVLARLLQALNPSQGDKILYIACGSGYGPALLNNMGAHVVALESDTSLSQEAERVIQELKMPLIEVVLGPLEEGWEAEAPYDKMFIEGSVEFIPETLLKQLKDGGSIVTLKRIKEGCVKAFLYIKKGSTFTEICLFDAFAPLLKVFKKEKPFIF
ncbi:MAG: protein-L-isoaspartate O-methyltransferase [Alphaproteobacteria bacterium]|nr:protein-L-isoaspartate O-methyltransferase [Alphaproteobacteria bacterium]